MKVQSAVAVAVAGAEIMPGWSGVRRAAVQWIVMGGRGWVSLK